MSQYDEYREAFQRFGKPSELIDDEHHRLYQIFDSKPDRKVATIRLTVRGPVFESFGAMSGPH